MKLLTPFFAIIACILMAGCEDQEYNETGAVPPGEVDEYATDTTADPAAETDAVLIIEEPATQPGMTGSDQDTYQSAKPAMDGDAGDQGADSSDSQSSSSTSSNDASATADIPAIEPGSVNYDESANVGDSKSGSNQQKNSSSQSGSDQSQSDQSQAKQQSSQSADESDAIKEVE